MADVQNHRSGTIPEDPDILATGTVNADEFRDIDLTTLTAPKSTDYSSVPNESMNVPHDSRAMAVQERRIYANGPEAISTANVSEEGTRRYAAFSYVVLPGIGGYPGEPILLLGEDRSRSRIVISHSNINSAIRIGPLDSVANGSGLYLTANLIFESAVTEPIYACVDRNMGELTNVSVWAEYA